MNQTITRKELAQAVQDITIALTIALPDMIRAINENNPDIALDAISSLNTSDAATDDTPYPKIILDSMTQAIHATWGWDIEQIGTPPGH